jgi:type II secretory pathway pseudopilin PulG
MPMAMLLTLVGITLSALLASLAMTHVRTTRQATSRTQAEHAALAGLDVVLGHIRAVARIGGFGNVGTLPCPAGGGVAVSGATADTGSYQAWVTYYTAGDTPMACPLTTVPAYARVRSRGSAPAQTTPRTLEARYTFQTTNENIPGGLIHVFREQATDIDRCLDGGFLTAGTVIKLVDCQPGAPQQTFVYTTGLTVKLKQADGYPEGLCVDGGAAPVVGAEVTLQRCLSPPADHQRWIFNVNVNFEGVKGKSGNGFCWNAEVPGTTGFPLVLGDVAATPRTCRSGPYNNRENFLPESAVGAGAAGPTSRQLVNFGQFGRCVDTPWRVDDVTGGKQPYVQAWPCKQAPDPADVDWNQRWTAAAVDGGWVRLYTVPPATLAHYQPPGDWCLQSPRSTLPGQYVNAQPCPATVPDDMKWKVVGLTDRYQDSYQIRDFSGNCLAAADQDSPDPNDQSHVGHQVMKLLVTRCTDSVLQKWNADPNALRSDGLQEYTED